MGSVTYYTNDPSIARHVLRESEFFTKKTSDPAHPLHFMADQEALFTCDSDSPAFGPSHRFIPPCMAPKAIRHYTPSVQQCVQKVLPVLDAISDSSLAFNVYQYMFKLAGQVIWKIVFGADLGHFDSLDAKPFETIRDLGQYVALMKRVSLRGQWYGYLPFGDPRRMREARDRVWKGIGEAIEQAARTGTDNRDLPLQEAALHAACLADYLQRAVDNEGNKLPREYLVSNCVILFGAGFLTSSSLLAWCIFALCRYEGVQDRLLQELVDHGARPDVVWTMDQLNAMPYLDQFVKETQRMHNPSFQTARNARRDVVLPGGKAIPAGSVVIPMFPALHKNPAHWDNPARFDPERWGTPAVKKLPRAAYTPFAAGSRGCIGFSLALLEVKMAMAILVYRYKFSDASLEPVVYDPDVVNMASLLSLPVHFQEASAMQETIQDSAGEKVINLNEFDLIPPRTFIKFIIYIPLKSGASFESVFAYLQAGLSRTLDRIPFLNGKIFERPSTDPGYVKGHLQIRHPKITQPGSRPRQLVFKDLSKELPSFDELRDAGFEFSAFSDALVLEGSLIPDISTGADVFRAQANFVQGGCLLATGFHHSSVDATGMVTVLKAWAEYCRSAGSEQQACVWLTPECVDRGILDRLWRAGWNPGRSILDIDPAIWGYLGFQIPGTEAQTEQQLRDQDPIPAYMQNTTMESRIFYISATNLAELLLDSEQSRQHANQEQSTEEQSTGEVPRLSANDVILALFWRSVLRARRLAAAASSAPAPADAMAHLESPLDGRAAFSAELPAAYVGNVVTVNRVGLRLEELLAPGLEALQRVAWHIRRGAMRAGPDMVRDAFALMRSTRDFSELKHGFTRLDGWDVMITSLLLLPVPEVDFGGDGGLLGGSEAIRPCMDAFNANFRLCMILPRTPGGGLELLVSLFPKEMQELERDDEFSRFAALLCH
ncbi:hypothetical protein MCOR30_008558 [Pyricularia oryzae]|nr:hypothetical protein MCOR30_008558 [Pyricularia oryzae]KAI6432467.1 hypothetical protein MCOR22_009750 [Pyricularia oryzae]